MDLYEALKTGTSVNDLKDAFFKELEDALNQINEEEAEIKRKKQLSTLRAQLAEAAYNYLGAIGGEDIFEPKDKEADIELFADSLLDVEDQLLPFFKIIKSSKTETKKEKTSSAKRSTDDDIIDAFLASLK